MYAITMSMFGDLLQSILDKRGWSYRDASDKLGVAHSFIYNVCSGKKLPKLDNLDQWCDAIGLSGDERADFKRKAWLSHAPAEIQALVVSLEGRLEENEHLNDMLLMALIQGSPQIVESLYEQDPSLKQRVAEIQWRYDAGLSE